MITAEERMVKRYSEMQKELRTISKWFHKNHGGPEVTADDIEDDTLRILTVAMSDRRNNVGQQMREIENFSDKNRIELPE